MTYHVAWDISYRYPEAAIGVIALACAALVVTLLLVPRWRPVLRRTSWLWLASAGLVWSAFGVIDEGIPDGLLFGVCAIPAFVVACYGIRDLDIPMRDGSKVAARFAASVMVPFYLLLTALVGCQQLRAFDLARQLAAGHATVVTGTVENFTPARHGGNGGPKGPECFTLTWQTYCYDTGGYSPDTVGFHWINDDGGPIRNGLQVRVSSIGKVIVRLEIADGQ